MSRPLPVWARRTVLVAGSALFAAGAFLSGWSLNELAEQAGVPFPFSLSLPLALDAGAAVGVALWVAGRDAIQRAGRSTARILFGLSLVGNAVERVHTYEQWDRAPIVVAVGVAVVFPLLAYRMAHLLLMVRHAEDVPVKRSTPVKAARPKRVPDSVPAAVSTPSTPRASTGLAERVDRARALEGELGRRVGWKSVAKDQDLTERQARTVVEKLREPAEAVAATNGHGGGR